MYLVVKFASNGRTDSKECWIEELVLKPVPLGHCRGMFWQQGAE